MMEAVLVFIAMVLVLAAGAGALLLIPGERDRFGFTEFLAYSWLLGAVLVTLAIFVAGQVLSGMALQTVVALGAVGLFLARAKRFSLRVAVPAFPTGSMERALLVAVALQVGFFCWLATRVYFGWDGLAVWEIKARAAFLNGGVPPAEFFADPTRRWCHQAYPLFLPLLESWVYTWLGECNQSWIRALFPAFYAAGVVAMGTGVGKLSGNRVLGWMAGCLPFFIPYLMHRDGGVASGYADVPLSMVYLAGLIQLLLFARNGDKGSLWLFGAMTLGLPWIKDEGLILWLCLACIGGVIAFRTLRWRSWMVVLPGLVTVVAWNLFKRLVQVPPNRDILPITPATLAAHLDRVGPLSRQVLRELCNLGHWSLLWGGVLVAIIISVLRWQAGDRARLLASLAVVAPFSIYTGIYLFSAAPDYMVHFWTSYPRLLLQLAPAGILVVILAGSERWTRAKI